MAARILPPDMEPGQGRAEQGRAGQGRAGQGTAEHAASMTASAFCFRRRETQVTHQVCLFQHTCSRHATLHLSNTMHEHACIPQTSGVIACRVTPLHYAYQIDRQTDGRTDRQAGQTQTCRQVGRQRDRAQMQATSEANIQAQR